jgi:hypothetical protein
VIAAYDDAIAGVPGEYVRDRAWRRFRCAEAYAYGNDPAQAATVACDAVQTLIDTGSDSILDKARKLHTGLGHANSSSAVREFGELLQTAGSQAST